MVAAEVILTLGIAGLASLFMAWAIGAGSSGSTPFAPAVGANAISIMRAGFVVGLFAFAGAVLQGENVTQAVGRELIDGVTLSPTAATVALTLAAALVAIGIFTGYPIATAFTVTGAVIGVGLAMGGDPAWWKYEQIAILWLGTPIVGSGAAYSVVRLLRWDRVDEAPITVGLGAIVGAMVTHIEFAALGPEGDSLAGTLGAVIPGPTVLGLAVITLLGATIVVAWLLRELRYSIARAQRRFLLSLGGLVAFSAGGSQVGLAIGPLIPLQDEFTLPLWALLVGGALGLLAGSWTGAPRMIKAISQDYSMLGPRRSIGALIPSFAIAQTAILVGVPISFNQIVISGVVGSGFASGGVSGRKLGYTTLAWVLSFIGAVVIGFGLHRGITAVI